MVMEEPQESKQEHASPLEISTIMLDNETPDCICLDERINPCQLASAGGEGEPQKQIRIPFNAQATLSALGEWLLGEWNFPTAVWSPETDVSCRGPAPGQPWLPVGGNGRPGPQDAGGGDGVLHQLMRPQAQGTTRPEVPVQWTLPCPGGQAVRGQCCVP